VHVSASAAGKTLVSAGSDLIRSTVTGGVAPEGSVAAVRRAALVAADKEVPHSYRQRRRGACRKVKCE
jgi:hypothetical protein